MDTKTIVFDWVRNFVVARNLCPFAALPLRQGRVAVSVCADTDIEPAFNWAMTQVQNLLDEPPETVETTLLAYPRALTDFPTFLDFIATLEDTLTEVGADELIQLAHFHPDYVFEGFASSDPAHGTNRSPVPIIQLLRVESVARAVAAYGDVEAIWARNAALLRGEPVGRSEVPAAPGTLRGPGSVDG